MKRKNRTAMADQVYRYAMEILDAGKYEILTDEYYLPSDVANAASNIFKNMIRFDRATDSWVVNRDSSAVFTLGLTWEASNDTPCQVKVCDEKISGTSRLDGGIFHGFDEVYKDEVRNLVNMMNEAWRLMKTANAVAL